MNQDTTTTYKKGPLLQRGAAFIIDSILLLAVLIPVNLLLIKARLDLILILEFIITAAYNSFFVARTGSTIGKRLLSLKVVNKNYEQPQLTHILIRETIGKYLSRLIFGLGFWWAVNDNNRQALHDKLAKTYVVKTNSDGTLIPTSESDKVSIFEHIIFFAIAVPFAISIGLGVFYGLVARPYIVSSRAMEPNYKSGALLAVSHAFSIKRGDVVTFSVKIANKKQEFIKRIVGLPGETVMIKDGDIYINGHLLNQSRVIPSGTKTPAGPLMKNGVAHKIPKGYFFVLSDNRAIGFDSRVIGFIPGKSITGKYWFCLLGCK